MQADSATAKTSATVSDRAASRATPRNAVGLQFELVAELHLSLHWPHITQTAENHESRSPENYIFTIIWVTQK